MATPFAIEDTARNVLDVVSADTALDALSAYSVAQGFGPYAHPESDDVDAIKAYVLDDGRFGGVFTNTEIVASPIGDEYVDVDYLKGLDDLALAGIIGAGGFAPVVEVADAIAAMRGGMTCARCGRWPATTRQTYRDWDPETAIPTWSPNDTIRCDRCAQDLREYCALPRISTVIVTDDRLPHAVATAPNVVPPNCTGYLDERGNLAHDGDTCPIHEAGLDIGDGDQGDDEDDVDAAIAADAAALKAYSVSPTRCAQMGDALAVIILDRHNRTSIDPKALEQARAALGLEV